MILPPDDRQCKYAELRMHWGLGCQARDPAQAQWCDLRRTVFGWTQVEFPFRVRSGSKLNFYQPLIIMVVGKAFFDVGHAPADHSNRRTDLQGYAAWEIHPVMKLTVKS